jgi:hypothetical protein
MEEEAGHARRIRESGLPDIGWTPLSRTLIWACPRSLEEIEASLQRKSGGRLEREPASARDRSETGGEA